MFYNTKFYIENCYKKLLYNITTITIQIILFSYYFVLFFNGRIACVKEKAIQIHTQENETSISRNSRTPNIVNFILI